MEIKYILIENGKETGPFTTSRIKQRIQAGELSPETVCIPKKLLGVPAPLKRFFPEITAAGRGGMPSVLDGGARCREEQAAMHQVTLVSAGSFLREVKGPCRITFGTDTMKVNCKVGPNLVPVAFLIFPYLFVIAVLQGQHAGNLAIGVFALATALFYGAYASTTKRDGFEVTKEHLGAVFSDGVSVRIPFARAPLAGIKKIVFQAPGSFFLDFERAFPGILPNDLRVAGTQEVQRLEPAAFKTRCKRATLSFILGISGILIGPIAAVPAVIYGFLALRDIRESAGGLSGQRDAVVGTILGLLGTVGWIIFFVVMEVVAK